MGLVVLFCFCKSQSHPLTNNTMVQLLSHFQAVKSFKDAHPRKEGWALSYKDCFDEHERPHCTLSHHVIHISVF